MQAPIELPPSVHDPHLTYLRSYMRDFICIAHQSWLLTRGLYVTSYLILYTTRSLAAQECLEKYDLSVYEAFANAFDHLPLATIFDSKVESRKAVCHDFLKAGTLPASSMKYIV